MTTSTLSTTIGPPTHTPDQVDRAIRHIRQHVEQAPRPRPVPYQHGVLFREPAYADGEPYAQEDDEDDS
ncbi:hypothetical protein ACIQVL_48580 [Streptomyces sp. NPDC090499]|uniref:hypothetical protein n=1 Tax=Streptomyces sp. NPDC090499 TaxID=3365965 RepID=UPI0038003F7D